MPQINDGNQWEAEQEHSLSINAYYRLNTFTGVIAFNSKNTLRGRAQDEENKVQSS